MRIRVLQHVAHEGPAAIADWATERGHCLEVTRVDLTGPPPRTEASDFLVILGGPMGVHDGGAHPWLEPEKRYIEDALRRAEDGSGAVLGVCLGAQLIAHLLGANVTRNHEVEIGWFPVQRTVDGAASVVGAAVPDGLGVLHWHGDTFDTPEGTARVLKSTACDNQAFEGAGGRIMGLQFHLEQTKETLPEMVAGNAQELAVQGAYIQSELRILESPKLRDGCTGALYSILDSIAERIG